MLGWLTFLIGGVALLGLASLLSRWFGRSHMGVKRSTDHHITENETWFRRPH